MCEKTWNEGVDCLVLWPQSFHPVFFLYQALLPWQENLQFRNLHPVADSTAERGIDVRELVVGNSFFVDLCVSVVVFIILFN